MSHFYSYVISLGISILGVFSLHTQDASFHVQSENSDCSEQNLTMMSNLTWIGVNGTNWNDPGNWIPSEVPDSGSLTGHHVIIPVVGSGNYPIVTGNSFARSVTVASGASVTIVAGGDLKVFGSDTDGYINGGLLSNAGNFRVDSSYNDALHNLAGASISNSGTIVLNSGTGMRLKNYAAINNSGNFEVSGGLGMNMINYTGSSIINTGNFSIGDGLTGRLENFGKIDNYGIFQIFGGFAGDGLTNRDSIFNRAGATFQVSNGTGRLMDNHHYIHNAGMMSLSVCFPIIPNEANYNRAGATFINVSGSSLTMSSTVKLAFRNEGFFEMSGPGNMGNVAGPIILNDSTGVMNINNDLNVTGSSASVSANFINHGLISIDSITTLTVSGGSGSGIYNYGTINSLSGCNLNISGFSQHSIFNFENAVFNNNCSSIFNNTGNTKIINQGRYGHLSGNISSNGGNKFLINSGYCELNVPMSFSGMPGLFENSDTLILNAACAVTTNSGFDQVFFNAADAYLFSDAQFNITSMGSPFLNNLGKAVLGINSSFQGTSLSTSSPVISNTDTLIMRGNIDIRSFNAWAISNSGHIDHSGNFHAHNITRGIHSNGGVIQNSGSIEIDSVSQNVLHLEGNHTFENRVGGSLTLNYFFQSGIINGEASSFLNEGVMNLALSDTVGQSVIINHGAFTNRFFINIEGGKIAQHAVYNTNTGNFFNNGILNIGNFQGSIGAFGIFNQGDMLNNFCGSVFANKNISNPGEIENYGFFEINSSENSLNTGTFKNYRVLNVIGGGSIDNITQEELPPLNCPPNQIVSSNAVLDLNTLNASPQGGVFAGPGVDGSSFIAADAGVGHHVLQYNIEYDVNCFRSCTLNIEVIPGNQLPPGWSQNINGIGCNEGSEVTYNDTTQIFSVNSINCYSGNSTLDNSAFAQYTLCGDGSITALVTDISGLGWAGIVMRESNLPGAKKVQLTTNKNSNLTRREIRSVTNGTALPQQTPALNRFWLRLVRQGNQFSGLTSPNGINWFPVMATNISMNSCIEIGLVVSNYNSNSTVNASFANVSVSGGNVTQPIPDNNIALNQVKTQNAELSVFPNPGSGEINLDLSLYTGKSVVIEVVSLQGQILLQREIDEVIHRTENINLTQQVSGTYIVRVKSDAMPDKTKTIILQSNGK